MLVGSKSNSEGIINKLDNNDNASRDTVEKNCLIPYNSDASVTYFNNEKDLTFVPENSTCFESSVILDVHDILETPEIPEEIIASSANKTSVVNILDVSNENENSVIRKENVVTSPAVDDIDLDNIPIVIPITIESNDNAGANKDLDITYKPSAFDDILKDSVELNNNNIKSSEKNIFSRELISGNEDVNFNGLYIFLLNITNN